MTLASFLEAYRAGLFPMAEPNGPVLWYRPVRRAVLPLDELRVADSLRRVVRSRRFDIRVNTAFVETITACSAPRSGESEDGVWLDARLQALLVEAHHAGRPILWRPGVTVHWWAGCMGCRLGRPSWGNPCSTGLRPDETPRRWRWCTCVMAFKRLDIPCWMPRSKMSTPNGWAWWNGTVFGLKRPSKWHARCPIG